MQTRSQYLHSWPRHAAWWVVRITILPLVLGMLGFAQVKAASANSPAKGKSKNASRVVFPPAKPTNAPSEELLVEVKSVFLDDPKVGKDPFFPKSARRLQSNASVVVTGPVEADGLFALQGLSFVNGRKLALINGRTFAEGEEQDVRVKGQTWRVKCVTIADRHVNIEARDSSSARAPANLRLEPRADLL